MTRPPPIDQLSTLGLSRAAAELRLARDGRNELPGDRPRSLWRIGSEVLAEPMFFLLLAAATLYMVLGDAQEASALCVSLLAVIAITLVQARRTEHALAKLRDLTKRGACVVRDHQVVRLASDQIVVGDVLVLSEGDRVVADAVLRRGSALCADESMLTGESLAVDKDPDGSPEQRRLYGGSLIVRGHGLAEVTATGARSQIGKIGAALHRLSPEPTGLVLEVNRVVRWVAAVGLLICVLIAVVYALQRHDLLGGALAGITVAMGVVPEEFPVVLTIFLAMGAWRMSRQGVLTRRMPAIEAIGAATLLAVDKTGTLTENRMQVVLLDDLDHVLDLRTASEPTNAAMTEVLITALLASEPAAFDPMEQAIHAAANRWAETAVRTAPPRQLVREYDLTPELLAVTHVWRDHPDGVAQVAVKGAPEAVLALCQVPVATRASLQQRIAAYTSAGLRVLAVASARHTGALPPTPQGFKLTLQGLLCLADPLRAAVPAALAECARAGLRVVMITGDHLGTAMAIAAQAGIVSPAGALTGAQLTALSAAERAAQTRAVNVYARMLPAHKLALVEAFKASGEIVAMTGDGVNDAPALQAAQIGVAMGQRGTDVARAAASLVLLRDDFASLVCAVRDGRRIYANIQQAMSYLIAVHLPIAALGLLPVLFNWPLLLFPLHVMLLELVVDPACSFVFEADAESTDLMQHPPRDPQARLFSRPMLLASVRNGLIATALITAIYAWALHSLPVLQARGVGLATLVLSAVLLIFITRRQRGDRVAGTRNVLLGWITGAALLATLLALYLAPLARRFHLTGPPASVMLVLVGMWIISVALLARPAHRPRGSRVNPAAS